MERRNFLKLASLAPFLASSANKSVAESAKPEPENPPQPGVRHPHTGICLIYGKDSQRLQETTQKLRELLKPNDNGRFDEDIAKVLGRLKGLDPRDRARTSTAFYCWLASECNEHGVCLIISQSQSPPTGQQFCASIILESDGDQIKVKKNTLAAPL